MRNARTNGGTKRQIVGEERACLLDQRPKVAATGLFLSTAVPTMLLVLPVNVVSSWGFGVACGILSFLSGLVL